MDYRVVPQRLYKGLSRVQGNPHARFLGEGVAAMPLSYPTNCLSLNPISRVTDAVIEQVINKAFYLALGVNMEGHKELLGLWLSLNEDSKFWLSVLTELQNRGVKDILIACVDGLKGFPDAIDTVYPQTQIQLCIAPKTLRGAGSTRGM